MRVGVELGGLPQLEARLDHAHAGILQLDRELVSELAHEAPPMVVAESVRMRARQWGVGDVWTLPAGGWIAPAVKLDPDPSVKLQQHVQQLLDG